MRPLSLDGCKCLVQPVRLEVEIEKSGAGNFGALQNIRFGREMLDYASRDLATVYYACIFLEGKRYIARLHFQ